MLSVHIPVIISQANDRHDIPSSLNTPVCFQKQRHSPEKSASKLPSQHKQLQCTDPFQISQLCPNVSFFSFWLRFILQLVVFRCHFTLLKFGTGLQAFPVVYALYTFKG